MYKKIKGRIVSVLTNLRTRRFWRAFTFSLVVAVPLFGALAWSTILNPVVRIGGSVAILTIECIPKDIVIETRASYAELRHASLTVIEDKAVSGPIELERSATISGGTTKTTFLLSRTQFDTEIKQFQNLKSTKRIQVRLDFVRVPFVDISRISLGQNSATDVGACAAGEWAGVELKDRISASQVRVMRVSLIQDQVSDLLVKINEFVGNIVLAILIIWIVWIGAIAVQCAREIWWLSDIEISERVNTRVRELSAGPLDEGVVDIIEADYELRKRRLEFARVMGPVIGFILTVSSLVAGLHPSAQINIDAFRFTSSLQIAMVATFAGLLLRIAAEIALRFLRDGAERKLASAIKQQPASEGAR